jgi:hypothetical protein
MLPIYIGSIDRALPFLQEKFDNRDGSNRCRAVKW